MPYTDRPVGRRIFIGIRANDIILCRTRPEGLSIRNALPGRILDVSEVAGKQLIKVDVGKRLAVEVTSEAVEELRLNAGDSVFCLIKTHSIRIGPEVE